VTYKDTRPIKKRVILSEAKDLSLDAALRKLLNVRTRFDCEVPRSARNDKLFSGGPALPAAWSKNQLLATLATFSSAPGSIKEMRRAGNDFQLHFTAASDHAPARLTQ